MAACRHALSLRPDHVEAICNLGNAIQLSGDPARAIECYRRAISLRPDYADAHANLGSALQEMGNFAEAIKLYKQAISLKPDHHMAHWNLGLVLLLIGDFQRGWPEFEWGWSRTRLAGKFKVSGPKWDGTDLDGKRILIHNEWALGDAIQMIRY